MLIFWKYQKYNDIFALKYHDTVMIYIVDIYIIDIFVPTLLKIFM